MKITEKTDGTFEMLAENESENRLVAVIQDLLWNDDRFTGEILRAHGCIHDDESGADFNYVTLPSAAEVFAELLAA